MTYRGVLLRVPREPGPGVDAGDGRMGPAASGPIIADCPGMWRVDLTWWYRVSLDTRKRALRPPHVTGPRETTSATMCWLGVGAGRTSGGPHFSASRGEQPGQVARND